MGFSNSRKVRRRKNKNGRDEDSNVNADNIPNSRELVQRMKEIVNCSEQEAYTMLMKCVMDADEAVNRLLNQVKDTPESVLTSLQKLSIENDEHLRFGSGMNRSGQPDGLSSQLLKNLALIEEEDQRIMRNLANQMNSNAASNYHSSSNYDQREPTQGNQNKSSSATDFTFDNNQLFNPVMAPSEPSPQKQNFNTFPNPMDQQAFTRDLGRWITATVDEALALASINKPQMNGQAMNQQAYTREPNPQYLASPLNQSMPTASSLDRRPSASNIEALLPASINKRQMKREAMNQQAYTRERDPRYSASPLNQSMPTATSHGRRPSASEIDAMEMASISKPQMNGQATNHHYSQPTVPSGHYGTMLNYPYSQPTQNDTYNMSPSAIQQHGGNNNAYHLRPLAALLPQHINTDLSPSAVPFVPSAYRSTNGSTYNSAYGFGMSSDNNAANSRFGSDNVFNSLLNNELPSFLHQNGNSNVWAPQGQNNSGRNYYGLFMGHQNQQSPSVIHSQQEQEQRYYESLDQQSNGRDPSNQTQL